MGMLDTLCALVTKTPHCGKDVQPLTRNSQRAQPTVMVIDDDQQFLNSVGSMLEAAGFAVLLSNSGSKGLNMLRYTPHDVHAMLLDYSMPGFNGDETLKHARQLKPNLKIIGVTGLALTELPPSYRDGVDALVLKPFNNSELVASIRKLLKGGRRPAAASN